MLLLVYLCYCRLLAAGGVALLLALADTSVVLHG
jgi:hypothetical protein